MLSFLNHKITKREIFLAKWSVLHVLIALLAGVVLTVGLLAWRAQGEQERMLGLQLEAASALNAPGDVPSTVPANAAKIGGPFALTGPDGKTVRDTDFAGKYLLVYFGYTNCPDMCPTGLQSISRAMDRLGDDADKVQPLFITVDPARDSPQRLRDYDSAFHPKIIGLTGSAESLAAVAKEYQVYYQKDEGDEDYDVDHSALIYLMNPSGNLVETFDEEADPALIVAALKKGFEKTTVRP